MPPHTEAGYLNIVFPVKSVEEKVLVFGLLGNCMVQASIIYSQENHVLKGSSTRVVLVLDPGLVDVTVIEKGGRMLKGKRNTP